MTNMPLTDMTTISFTGPVREVVGSRIRLETALRAQGWTEGASFLNGAEHVVEWSDPATGDRIHIGRTGLDAPWPRATQMELRVMRLGPSRRSTITLTL